MKDDNPLTWILGWIAGAIWCAVVAPVMAIALFFGGLFVAISELFSDDDKLGLNKKREYRSNWEYKGKDYYTKAAKDKAICEDFNRTEHRWSHFYEEFQTGDVYATQAKFKAVLVNGDLRYVLDTFVSGYGPLSEDEEANALPDREYPFDPKMADWLNANKEKLEEWCRWP